MRIVFFKVIPPLLSKEGKAEFVKLTDICSKGWLEDVT